MQTTLTNEQINLISVAEKRNMPLSELGRKTGYNGSYFYDIKGDISKETLRQAATILGVTTENLHAEPTVNINNLPGNVGLLTRLREACNYLHISALRFYKLTGIHVHKAYIKHIPPERISTVEKLLGVSKEYLLYGANAETAQKQLRENRAYLTWKLSGYNTGEERDLIVSLARETRKTIYELEKLFSQNNIPSYILRTSNKKSLRPNMTDREREKIADLLNISVDKLKTIQTHKEENFGQRLPAHHINKDYPFNLIADIEEKLPSGKVTEKELKSFFTFLTQTQAYCIKERYKHHKTITKIAAQRHTSKQAVSECIKNGIRRIIENIAEQCPGNAIEIPETKESAYPDNLLKVLNKHVAMDGVPVSIEAVEEIVTRLSKENQNFYQKIFIEGKTVAMVQEEMNLLAKDRQKLHNKRHELVSQIIYQLNKQVAMQ